MRIATWNVNSLKARMDRLMWWLDRAQPDVLLIQETKLSDGDAPILPLRMRGYELVHHGEGRWNGVAIASRLPVDPSSIITNFGDGSVRDSGPGVATDFAAEDFNPFDEARMVSAVAGDIRFVCLYAPNGRVVGSVFYKGKLAWYDRLSRWLSENIEPGSAAVVGGDMNVAPTPADVWDERAVHGGTHVSEPEREAFADLLSHGFIDGYRAKHDEPGRFSWWDYRQGHFHKNMGMRIDHLLLTSPVAERLVWAEIDREARKGVPVPSDHAPVLIDIDEPGIALDPGWEGALERIAARTRPGRKFIG
ncbi:MAG TPA: exodeoxyribonuclease III [Candidatus Limnocylindrales bacterium]|nr:exodeoxyribonuclease III [Candidatus Limnocylindrales bacterium]